MLAFFMLIVPWLCFQPDMVQATGDGFQNYELHTGRDKLVFCLSVAPGETDPILLLVLGQAQPGSCLCKSLFSSLSLRLPTPVGSLNLSWTR